jgi:hypothetical protein
MPLVATALAAAALLVAGYAALRPSPAPAGPAACTCNDDALRRDVEDLRRTVQAASGQASDLGTVQMLKRLASRVETLESKVDAEVPGSSGSAGGDRTTGGAPSAAERIVKFDLPSDRMQIKQMEDGSFAVTNSDPALAGKMLTVQAHRGDGTIEQVSIVVPPP